MNLQTLEKRLWTLDLKRFEREFSHVMKSERRVKDLTANGVAEHRQLDMRLNLFIFGLEGTK